MILKRYRMKFIKDPVHGYVEVEAEAVVVLAGAGIVRGRGRGRRGCATADDADANAEVARPFGRAEEVVGAVVACYPPQEMLKDESFARLCDRRGNARKQPLLIFAGNGDLVHLEYAGHDLLLIDSFAGCI
jgi:hypothetical protein